MKIQNVEVESHGGESLREVISKLVKRKTQTLKSKCWLLCPAASVVGDWRVQGRAEPPLGVGRRVLKRYSEGDCLRNHQQTGSPQGVSGLQEQVLVPSPSSLVPPLTKPYRRLAGSVCGVLALNLRSS